MFANYLKAALDLGLPILNRHETGGLTAVLFSLRHDLVIGQ